MRQEQATSRVTTARGGHCPTPYTSPASAQGQPAPSTAPFYPDPRTYLRTPSLPLHAAPTGNRRPFISSRFVTFTILLYLLFIFYRP